MRHLLILSLAAAASWAAAGSAQDPLPAYSVPQFPFLFDEPGATALVDAWYQKYLGRSATTDPGSSYWVNQLVQGKSPISVLAGLLSSQEYFETATTTPTEFVNHLFASVLGRKPTPQESQYWWRRATLDDIQDNEIRRNLIYDFLANYERNVGGGSIVLPQGVLGQQYLRQQQNYYNLDRPYYPYRL
jgi:hypothetical protein